jgi:uncharacterized protein (TIGR02266 family)
MMDVRNVLVVEVPPALFEIIAPVLQRKEFEVDRFPHAGRALDLLAVVPFTAVIVGFPLREAPLDRFLQTVRGGPSASASVALLARAAHLAEAQAFLGRGADLVLQMEKAPKEAQRLLCTLLGVSARAAVRIMVRLQLYVEQGSPGERLLAQTHDISSSGMLVAARRRFPLGSLVRFELVLPGDHAPVTGDAEVARHADAVDDRPEGMGLRFSSLHGDSQVRLQRYLESIAPPK